MSGTPTEELVAPSSPLADDITVNGDIDTSPKQDTLKEASKEAPSPAPASTNTPSSSRPSPGLEPYIHVLYNDQTVPLSVWGRAGVATMGYQAFAKTTFDAFILHPSRAPPRKCSLFKKSDRAIWQGVYNYLKADFHRRVMFIPQFAIPGSGEGRGEETFSLQPVGWREMALQLVSIRVRYKVPEEYPGKADLVRMYARSTK